MTREPDKQAPLPRARAWIAGGALAGIMAGAALGAETFIVFSLSEMFPLSMKLSHGLLRKPGWEDFFGWIVAGLIWGNFGGLISTWLPRRWRYPMVLAVFWGSALGSLALVLACVYGMTEPHSKPIDYVAILVFLLGPGAVFGFVLGLSAPIAERIVARFTRPPAAPEPPQ